MIGIYHQILLLLITMGIISNSWALSIEAPQFSQHTQWKGLLRYGAQYREQGSYNINQDSEANDHEKQFSSLGGYLGFETLFLRHASFGATIYTSSPFGNNPNSHKALGGLAEPDDCLSCQQQAYTTLGEAFLNI